MNILRKGSDTKVCLSIKFFESFRLQITINFESSLTTHIVPAYLNPSSFYIYFLRLFLHLMVLFLRHNIADELKKDIQAC